MDHFIVFNNHSYIDFGIWIVKYVEVRRSYFLAMLPTGRNIRNYNNAIELQKGYSNYSLEITK